MATMTIPRSDWNGVARRGDSQPRSIDLEHRAHETVSAHCHFRGRADDFQFEQRDGVLTVHGRVPSYYLKQILQTVLKDLDGVQRIDNRVDVVCCDGLSSVRVEKQM